MSNETIRIYDSLRSCGGYSVTKSFDLFYQIASFLHTDATDSLTVEYAPVQQQPPLSGDCGIYAIAYMVPLLNGKDPSIINFDKDFMRSHLHSCLKNNTITPFPESNQRQTFSKKHKQQIPLYCSSRMPYEKKFLTSKFGNKMDMAQCNRCKGWFHRVCESIPPRVFKLESAVWACKRCTR